MRRALLTAILAGAVVTAPASTAQNLKAPEPNAPAATTGSGPKLETLRLVISNPQLKVLRINLPPHGSVSIRREIHDYVLLAITGGSLEAGGNVVDMAAGEPAVLRGGWTHTLRSRSDQPTSWILVETANALQPEKAVCGLGGANCTQFRFGKGDAGEYEENLLFETVTVRVSRIKLAPASGLPTHTDRRDHLVIPVADCNLKVNGGAYDSRAGDPLWLRGSLPEFRNAGAGPVQLVMLEMK
jgi:hypothetical protein